MKTINSSSTIARFAYRQTWPFNVLGWEARMPSQTSLCPLFWRTAVGSPVIWLLGVVCIATLIPLFYVTTYPVVVGVMALKKKINRAKHARWEKLTSLSPEEYRARKEASIGYKLDQFMSLLFDFVAAKKEKVCPTIRINYKK